MSKKLYILLIFILSLLMISCKKKDNKNFNIALVSDNSYIEDDSRFKQIQSGILKSSEDINLNSAGAENSEQYTKKMSSFIKDNYTLIVGTGFLQNDIIRNLASQNEGVKFVLFDSIIDPPQKNILSIAYKYNESAFLVGYIAGMTTKTDKIGYIGYKSNIISDMYEYGFKAGIYQAAKELQKNIGIKVEHIESFKDFSKGKKLADEMYSKDIDIIYQTVGYTGQGVIESAKQNDKLVIGNIVDQSNLAKKNVLTSSIINYEKSSENIINRIKSETNLSGKIYHGIKESVLEITEYTEDSIIDKNIYDKTMLLKEKVKNGEIVVPFNEETYQKIK